MTRDEFDTIYLQEYDNLCRYAKRGVGEDGLDIVHTMYANAVEHTTYTNGPLKHAKRWIYFKLSRELVRHRKALATRHEAELEGGSRLVESMEEAEWL